VDQYDVHHRERRIDRFLIKSVTFQIPRGGGGYLYRNLCSLFSLLMGVLMLLGVMMLDAWLGEVDGEIIGRV
jgi:hypothetical protein